MMRRMKHGTGRSAFALAFALAIAGVAVTAAPATAQTAAALGKPLPSPDLPVGAVTVRIVAGSPASPVAGTSVTLVVNNVPREARTDSAGRATFAGLAPGATVVAKVVDDDKAEHASDPFPIPDAGGTRVMISTKPWMAGAGAAGAPGGGMPNPRQLSGEGRIDQGDPPGTLTVRVSYDDFKDAPEGVVVALVGYSSDDTTNFHIARSDAAGRVQFGDLDRGGGTAYFVMTLLPRNGAVDRLMSLPLLLDSQHGVRMVLSSEKRESTAPPIDDLNKGGEQQIPTPAGKVRVVLEGAPDPGAVVTLIEAATRKPIANAKPQASAADPSKVQGGAQFNADPKLPPGTLDVAMVGGPGQTENPLPGIELRVMPAASTDVSSGLASVTGADGTMRMALQVTGPQKAVFTINGRALASQPFDLTKSGGKLVVRAHWDDVGRLEAMLDAPSQGQIVYAECVSKGQRYRSMPFHVLDATGSKVSVYVFPRTMFRFSLQASVEDQLLAAQGRFEVSNYSWAPYRAGPDGLLVPMPHGFKGGVVFGSDQAEVSVAPGEGFRIMRPIPPGGRQFHAGFSLPVDAGNVSWKLDLPMGAYQSELDIRQTPGMTVHTPPNVPSEVRTVTQGTFTVIGPIGILPKQQMALTIEGMPTAAAWRTWVPRVIGLLVVGVILTGLGFALLRKPERAVVVSTDARRQRLLEQLVELEREGGNPKRREQLLHELEQLWG